MLVAGLGDAGVVEVDAEAGAEERLLDVVRGQGIAGEELVNKSSADELAEGGAAAGVDDSRTADDKRFTAGAAIGDEIAGDFAD